MADLAPMTPADYPEVMALWRDSEGIGLSGADSRPAVAAYLERNPGMSWVAREGGRVVGAALCGHDGRRGFLHHVAVARSHRGRGIGRELVRRCVEGLRGAGLEKCHLFVQRDNREAVGFWERMGWQVRDDITMMSLVIATPEDVELPR